MFDILINYLPVSIMYVCINSSGFHAGRGVTKHRSGTERNKPE